MKRKPKYTPTAGGNALLNSGTVVENIQPLGRGRWQGLDASDPKGKRQITFTEQVVVFSAPLGVWHVAMAMFQRENAKPKPQPTSTTPRGWDVIT